MVATQVRRRITGKFGSGECSLIAFIADRYCHRLGEQHRLLVTCDLSLIHSKCGGLALKRLLKADNNKFFKAMKVLRKSLNRGEEKLTSISCEFLEKRKGRMPENTVGIALLEEIDRRKNEKDNIRTLGI